MIASHDTILQIIEVISKHVDKETLKKIIIELMEVEGNTSFKMSIRRLNEVMK